MSARVLVADDDPLICKVIATVLSRAGFDVSTANDGTPSLEPGVGSPDLAVVDYNMPTCGLELVRYLKTTYGDDIFVALLSGDDNEEMRADARAAGADTVLIKPVVTAELRHCLTAAAAQLQAQRAAS